MTGLEAWAPILETLERRKSEYLHRVNLNRTAIYVASEGEQWEVVAVTATELAVEARGLMEVEKLVALAQWESTQTPLTIDDVNAYMAKIKARNWYCVSVKNGIWPWGIRIPASRDPEIFYSVEALELWLEEHGHAN